MLVASTALSLITPLAAQASDTVNLEEMNNYSGRNSEFQRFDSKTFINEVSEDLAILKGRVDGLEAQQNELEAGAFSETTSMSSSLNSSDICLKSFFLNFLKSDGKFICFIILIKNFFLI